AQSRGGVPPRGPGGSGSRRPAWCRAGRFRGSGSYPQGTQPGCSLNERPPRDASGMTQTRREIIQAFVPNSPLVGLLGIELAEIEADRAVLRLPFRPELATM